MEYQDESSHHLVLCSPCFTLASFLRLVLTNRQFLQGVGKYVQAQAHTYMLYRCIGIVASSTLQSTTSSILSVILLLYLLLLWIIISQYVLSSNFLHLMMLSAFDIHSISHVWKEKKSKIRLTFVNFIVLLSNWSYMTVCHRDFYDQPPVKVVLVVYW